MKKIVFITLLAISGICSAQDSNRLRLKGFVDTYHAVRIEDPNDFLASRSRFRGEIEKINNRSYFFVSLNAVHNNIIPELTKIQFREAFLEYTGDSWGFKAGRQIIIWGKADGMRITDVISPMDLTEFLAQDYDDIRMPVNGIVLSKFSNNWDLDLVCVPVFESYILPGEGNPWGMDYSQMGPGIVLEEARKPEISLSNVEYGGKLSFYLSGIDFDISALRTWNKAPVYSYSINDSTSALHMRPEHHRLGFVGLGFSKSLSAFILRGESAFYFDKKFSPNIENYEAGLPERNSINYLFGIDWYPGNDWTLTGQFSDEYILDYSKQIENTEHTCISTLGISKKVLRSTLNLSTFGYIGLNEGDFFNRTSADYSLSDNIHVMAGFDWFHGNAGLFGQYNDNSQVWVKAKFSF
jgi:hypothetical protein